VAFVIVTVEAGENVPPVAVDDVFQTVRGTAITFDTTLNDFDFDGDPLEVSALGTPANGEATLLADGQIRYAPEEGFVGREVFDVTISDGRGGTAMQNVLVIVEETANRAPVAVDDRFLVPAEGATALPVRDNDSDPDGDALVVVAVEQPRYGTLTLAADGDPQIVPSSDFVGADGFCYVVGDDRGGFDRACVVLVIGDRDDDGIGDREEELIGTDPDDPDTDDDGLRDGEELELETDPLDADSDDDGIRDGDEVAGSGPLAGYEVAGIDHARWSSGLAGVLGCLMVLALSSLLFRVRRSSDAEPVPVRIRSRHEDH
jgi:hypothetical protein